MPAAASRAGARSAATSTDGATHNARDPSRCQRGGACRAASRRATHQNQRAGPEGGNVAREDAGQQREPACDPGVQREMTQVDRRRIDAREQEPRRTRRRSPRRRHRRASGAAQTNGVTRSALDDAPVRAQSARATAAGPARSATTAAAVSPPSSSNAPATRRRAEPERQRRPDDATRPRQTARSPHGRRREYSRSSGAERGGPGAARSSAGASG